MTRLEIPTLFERLPPGGTVLIAGCGGGYDVYCGVPLYLALARRGHRVHLANLSFANLRIPGAERITSSLARVSYASSPEGEYHPEFHLASWLHRRGLLGEVFGFERTGVQPLRRAYAELIDRLSVDAVIVVDGGTDSLMFGSEAGLGTPHEDAATLIALHGLSTPSFLTCLGFGVDAFHGVCHAHFLENTAAMAKSGAFLGVASLLPQMEEAIAYAELVRFSTERTPNHPSIVNESIVAAVEGEYGNHHSTHRTSGSELWINPLMATYWSFELHAVAECIEYRHVLERTETFQQVVRFLEPVINRREGRRPWQTIPV